MNRSRLATLGFLIAGLSVVASVARAQEPSTSSNDQQELLRPDDATTRTLALSLDSLERDLENLRVLAETPGQDAPFAQAAQSFARRAAASNAAARRIAGTTDAPDNSDAIANLAEHARSSYEAQDRAALGEALRDASEEVYAIEQRGVRLVRDPAPHATDVEWKDGPSVLPDFRATLGNVPMRELQRRLASQAGNIRESSRDAVMVEDRCRRVIEIARELASRATALRDSSRRSFLDATRRAEVIAENVARLAKEKNDAHLRRQMRLLDDVCTELDGFLRQNDF